MRHKVLLFSILFVIAGCLRAQNRESFWKRLVVGGNLGAQFGTITLIEVSPNIGYKLTDEWIAGIGLRYIYLNDSYYKYKTDIYGASVYTQYYFLNSFLLHSEVERLNLDYFDPFSEQIRRVDVTSVLVGGGLKIQAGGNAYITTLVLWNLNETLESPYTNPIIRLGIAVGI